MLITTNPKILTVVVAGTLATSNNSGNGGSTAFNKRSASWGNTNNSIRTYNNTSSSQTALAGAQLPIIFFVSLAVGIGVSVGISQLM